MTVDDRTTLAPPPDSPARPAAAPPPPPPTPAPHLPAPGHRTPVSTYRLQLGPDLTFAQAEAQLDYLDDLGVTDLYLSPILQAAPGSTHGYDVVDHSRISDVMGGRPGFESLATAAHDRGMGVVVDVVPNHMGVPTPLWSNPALWQVLKDGPASPFATWFDGTDGDGEGILMPVLGARIGTVLADGEITRETVVVPGFADAGPQVVLRYVDHVFPVRAGTEDLPIAECVEQQFYRLAYWKVAAEELNFRRFFDVDTLVALRVEDPAVFDATHALLLDLFRDGLVDGFRIDHPDGLADPRGYLRRLSDATGGAWIVAEKILEGDETLPDDWPVAGTTGYDAAWRIGALQCQSSASGDLAAVAHLVAGDVPGTFPDVVEQAKREIATRSLLAEVHRIAKLAHGICRDDITLRDHTFSWIRACVTELVVAFDRYRAYVVPGEPAPGASVALIDAAADAARQRLDPDLHDTLDAVVDLVLGRPVGSADRPDADAQAQRDELVVRFQQVCGAVTAKGVEDTAFYRWTHLTSLNEVGGAPESWDVGPDHLHEFLATTSAAWPATMTCGTTHDTKRSEDVRARGMALSQFAPQWRDLVARIRPRPGVVEGHTENLVWQTIAATWTPDGPIELERLQAYALKASREQKLWTSWTHPDTDAEQALTDWLAEVYADDEVMGEFAAWYELTAPVARTNLLCGKAIQLTCLGVADVYQGSETLTNTLVDPDNRRPVDFDALATQLTYLDRRDPLTLAEEKLHLTREILRLRRRRPDAFVGPRADYRPLPSSTGHAFCFARGDEPQVVVVAIRLHRALAAAEGFTEHTVVLPEGRWVDVLTGDVHTGGSVLLADLLRRFPCAILESTEPDAAAPAVPPAEAADDSPRGLFGWLIRAVTGQEGGARG